MVSALTFPSPTRGLSRFISRACIALAASLSAVLLIGAPAPAAELPSGIYSLTPPGKPVPSAILAHPLVAGVTVRWQWPQVEPAEGVYDWSYLDREIAKVAAAGKTVLLRISAGGRNTPAWVVEAGAQTFSFVDTTPYSPTYRHTLTIPVFWDPIFLAKKTAFIAAMGQHFSAHPNLVLVSSSCANAKTDDWGLPNSPTDVQILLALGYTSQKLIDACADIIEATMAAFPYQYTLMAINRGPKGLDPHVDDVATQVVKFATTRYPGRFITQKNSLSARTWDPWTASQLHGWQVLDEARPMVAGQMLWRVTNDPTCRMNGKTTPCHPVQVLRQAVTIGAHYDMLYQEIYQQDLLNPKLAKVIREAAKMLRPD